MRLKTSSCDISKRKGVRSKIQSDARSNEEDNLKMTLPLMFTCCSILAPEARVALTLREVCGLTHR